MRSLKLLFSLLRLMERDSASQNSAFMKRLTARQLQVALLLEEWWTGRYDEVATSRIKQLVFGYALVEQCAGTGQSHSAESYHKGSQELEAFVELADRQLFAKVVRDLEQGREPIEEFLPWAVKLVETGGELPFQVINQVSKYHGMLYLIFHLKFSTLCTSYEVDTVPHDLDEVLYSASQLAAAKRISWPSLQQLILDIEGEDKNASNEAFKLSGQHVIKDFSRSIPTNYEPCQRLQGENCAVGGGGLGLLLSDDH
jgi:hypothetical protein